jgi:hypothetical protein
LPIQIWELVRMNRCVAAAIFVCLLCGCFPPRPTLVVTDPDPSVKIPAIRKAVSKKDLSTAKQLVEDLESDDPAVRFYAVNGLRRLTGEDFGYQYYQSDEQRRPAVQRWKQWLQESGYADVELERPEPRPL